MWIKQWNPQGSTNQYFLRVLAPFRCSCVYLTAPTSRYENWWLTSSFNNRSWVVWCQSRRQGQLRLFGLSSIRRDCFCLSLQKTLRSFATSATRSPLMYHPLLVAWFGWTCSSKQLWQSFGSCCSAKSSYYTAIESLIFELSYIIVK